MVLTYLSWLQNCLTEGLSFQKSLPCWRLLLGYLKYHPARSIFPKLSRCPANYLTRGLNGPSPFPFPASSASYIEYLLLKFWRDIHFHTGTQQWPKHTIISSEQDEAQAAVLIRVFFPSSHSSEIRAKGIQKMTAQGNCFFINVLFSQVYSRAIALLRHRKTH